MLPKHEMFSNQFAILVVHQQTMSNRKKDKREMLPNQRMNVFFELVLVHHHQFVEKDNN
jgi:hypothetical protein